MTWRTRNDMTSNLRTAFIVGLLILVIFLWILWCTAGPEAETAEYIETPQQREQIEKRMRYHGLGMNGVEVMRECGESWCFYRQGQWVRL